MLHQQRRLIWALVDFQKDKIQEPGRHPERVERGRRNSCNNLHIQRHSVDGLKLSGRSGQATSEPGPTEETSQLSQRKSRIGLLASCSRSCFLKKLKCVFHLGIQGPRVQSKTGEEQNLSCLRSTVNSLHDLECNSNCDSKSTAAVQQNGLGDFMRCTKL